MKLHWKHTDNVKQDLAEVSINADLQTRCDADDDCHNWLWTSIITWMLATKSIDTVIPVPDEFHDYLGLKHIHFIRFNDGVIHVMV